MHANACHEIVISWVNQTDMIQLIAAWRRHRAIRSHVTTRNAVTCFRSGWSVVRHRAALASRTCEWRKILVVVYSPDFQCYHAHLSAPGSWAGVSCFVRVCVCGDVFIFVCIYIYIYTHTHTHTHIYIYIFFCGCMFCLSVSTVWMHDNRARH